MRVVFRVVADQSDALWRRKDACNTQYLFRPEHLLIAHLRFAGIGYDLVAVEHPVTTVELLILDQASDALAGKLMQHPDFIPTAELWQNRDIRGEQYLFVAVKLQIQVAYQF